METWVSPIKASSGLFGFASTANAKAFLASTYLVLDV